MLSGYVGRGTRGCFRKGEDLGEGGGWIIIMSYL